MSHPILMIRSTKTLNQCVIFLSLIIVYILFVAHGDYIVKKLQIINSNNVPLKIYVTQKDSAVVYSLSSPLGAVPNYIKFSIDYELPDNSNYDNLFQTAPLNNGIRLEYSGNTATVLLSDENQTNKLQGFRVPTDPGWHNLKIEALNNKYLNINVDGRTIDEAIGYIPHFDTNEIAFGKGYSDSRIFRGNFKNIHIEARSVNATIWPERLLSVIKVTILMIIVLILYLEMKQNGFDYLIAPDDQSYTYVLFYFYVGYFCILFSTNIYSTHPVSYFPFIILVAAPFRWSWCKIYGLKFPLPTEFSLINVIKNVSYCFSSIMIAYIIYIANKGIVSSIYQANMPYVDFYFTEYFVGLLAFSIGFIRIAVEFENFSMWLFLCVSPFVAINGIVNINQYIVHLPELTPNAPLPRLFPWFGPGVNIGSPTSAALTYAFYIYGLAASVHKIVSSGKRRLKPILVATIYFLPMCSAMLLTQSRGGVLGLFIATIVTVLILPPFKTIKKVYLKFLTSIFIILFFLLIPPVRKYFTGRSDQHRIEVWGIFMVYARENLLFGVGDRGLGGIKFGETQLFNVRMLDGEVIHHGHNIFLNALLRGGIIGISSLSYLCFGSLKASYEFAKEQKNTIPLGGLLVFLVSSQVDFDLHIYPAPWMLTSNWTPILLATAIGSMAQFSAQNSKIERE